MTNIRCERYMIIWRWQHRPQWRRRRKTATMMITMKMVVVTCNCPSHDNINDNNHEQDWQQQLSCRSPASALPTGPTAGQRDPCDPPFWPVETPFIRNNLFSLYFFLAFFNSLHSFLEHSSISYIYDGRLFLFVPAGAASHVQESHLAPETWTKKSEQFKQCLGIW